MIFFFLNPELSLINLLTKLLFLSSLCVFQSLPYLARRKEKPVSLVHGYWSLHLIFFFFFMFPLLHF